MPRTRTSSVLTGTMAVLVTALMAPSCLAETPDAESATAAPAPAEQTERADAAARAADLQAGGTAAESAADETDDQPEADAVPPAEMDYVRITTSKGPIIVALDREAAPMSVANFLQYVKDEAYDGTIFHRVMATFMIQGGGFEPDGTKRENREGVRNEWTNGLPNTRGSIAMARIGGQPHSGTNQFFINVVDNAALSRPGRDGSAYAVFGTVVDGLQVVDEIRAVPVATGQLDGGPRENVPTEPVLIESVRRIDASELSEDAQAETDAWITAHHDKRERMRDLARRYAQATEALADAAPTATGLVSAVIEEGEGPTVPEGSTIVASYSGWLTDGWCFDSSLGRGDGTFEATLAQGRLISGWVEGIQMMKVGETRVFRIPAELGYGARAIPPQGPIIPANSTLIFEVTLRSFEPAAG